ncbi:MAG: NAD(P)H-hydrate dehydratase [Chloroflexi bacterium]|nr:MAG: NAD(P)H-hydrate dehydratase [Anaerolineaceae bacterium 4572_32.2]RLC86358.1 MAG: NAD(P)H-hydrate dehydratase [Chloroflexota bacterium]HEY73262.1 NAD(P)H-hydrate dehydratase [Thermoflexia bacterium]
MKIVSVSQMRLIEAASDAAGHSYAAMMEQAGRAVAEAITARRDVQDKLALVLVGPGNNGGDGLVAARYLAEAGSRPVCYLLKPRDPAQDENFRLVQERGLIIVLADEDGNEGERWRKLHRLAREADVVVDALLGTGARLPLRGPLAETLTVVGRTLAARKRDPRRQLTSLAHASAPAGRDYPFSVAVDGPSGLDYDDGALDAAALPADLTVTFAYPKPGHFRFPGAGSLGELVVADIGTDPDLATEVSLEVVTPEMVREWLPLRPPDSHKGTFGKTLIVAGSVNYTGAAYLSGAAATRAGTGLATMALPAAIHTAVAARLAEATYLLLPHELGVIASSAARVVAERIEEYDALLLGPGLGCERETIAFVEALLGGGGRRRLGFGGGEEDKALPSPLPPLVVDADGLNILAQMENWPERLPPESVLTPHPGEMARLMNCTIGDVQADRVAAARSQSAAWGQVVVLKGAHTVVAAPDGRIGIEPFVNSGLATAGTGDVLAGTIVALLAQELGAFEAAAAGAYLHGLAGELARAELGAAGMVAGDVLARLPQAWRHTVGA